MFGGKNSFSGEMAHKYGVNVRPDLKPTKEDDNIVNANNERLSNSGGQFGGVNISSKWIKVGYILVIVLGLLGIIPALFWNLRKQNGVHYYNPNVVKSAEQMVVIAFLSSIFAGLFWLAFS